MVLGAGRDRGQPAHTVAATTPRFVAPVHVWQRVSRISPHDTVLIGFSQGAILALESTQQPAPLAARVVALAGRFAQAPRDPTSRRRTWTAHGRRMPVCASAGDRRLTDG